MLDPPAQYLLSRVESHRKWSNKKISKGETNEEIIVNSPQLGIQNHAEYDEEVGEYGYDDDGHQGDTDQYFLEQLQLRQLHALRQVSLLTIGWVYKRAGNVFCTI